LGCQLLGILAAQDEYARQVLHAMVTNYQEEHWDKDIAGLRKQPLVIVGRCRDPKEEADFKARYASSTGTAPYFVPTVSTRNPETRTWPDVNGLTHGRGADRRLAYRSPRRSLPPLDYDVTSA